MLLKCPLGLSAKISSKKSVTKVSTVVIKSPVQDAEADEEEYRFSPNETVDAFQNSNLPPLQLPLNTSHHEHNAQQKTLLELLNTTDHVSLP